MSEKRKCIFTGEEADWLLQIGNDSQNWAKKVPCTRKWYDENKDRPLSPKEFRLVELFFQVEVARLKSSNFAALQEQVRKEKGSPDLVVIDDPGVPLPEEFFDEPPLIPEKGEVVLLSTPEKDDKIVKKVVKKKPTLWD